LVPTLAGFVAQFNQLADLDVEVDIDPAVERLSLTPEIELHLLRIAQEALANVRKHAAASRARVSLWLHDQVLTLQIRDDGRGFDPDCIGPTHWPHIGLSTMRERTEAIGGQFELDTRPGGGTTISVQLDLAQIALPYGPPKEC
jgi:signal transduction histidine kinase